eukprot:972438-Alexandrium_andersonii.AAC.1
MCIDVLLARFPELRHFESSDPKFREQKGQAAMQLLADVACANTDCLRVGRDWRDQVQRVRQYASGGL